MFYQTELLQIRIGAGHNVSEIEARWRRPPSAKSLAGLNFSHHRRFAIGYLAGNLATASPIGDSAPLLLACNANTPISAVPRAGAPPANVSFLLISILLAIIAELPLNPAELVADRSKYPSHFLKTDSVLQGG